MSPVTAPRSLAVSHQALGGTEGTGAGVTHAPWVSLKHSVLMKAFPLVAPGAGQEQRWATFSPPAPSRGSCPASSAARSPAAAGVTPGAGLAAPGGSAGSRSQTCPHREVLGGRGGVRQQNTTTCRRGGARGREPGPGCTLHAAPVPPAGTRRPGDPPPRFAESRPAPSGGLRAEPQRAPPRRAHRPWPRSAGTGRRPG